MQLVYTPLGSLIRSRSWLVHLGLLLDGLADGGETLEVVDLLQQPVQVLDVALKVRLENESEANTD